jgi:predicted ATPase
MITSLQARNFKSWKDTGDLRIAPLTGLFGTNSSGKTSILQMLLMLKQTAESSDRRRVLHTGDDQSLVDLGTFFDLIHGHRSDATLEFRVAWDLPNGEHVVITDPDSTSSRAVLFDVRQMEFRTSISVAPEGPATVDSFAYAFGGNRFGMGPWTHTQVTGAGRYDLDYGDYELKRTRGKPTPLPPPVKCYGFPDEAVARYQNTGFLPDLTLAFEKLFSRVTYLGPLREYPKRTYVWAGDRPVDVGRRGELAVAALLAARALQRKSPRGEGHARRYKLIEERILEWMRVMQVIHDYRLEPLGENRKDYEFRVKQGTSGPEVLITDVGFGVSQLLPVLVLCYYADEGSTILLEQPEIHLHPSVQSVLADVLIDVVKQRSVQVIVESHSEHLLRRLQRRIAEEKLSRDDAALYFCRMAEGESRIDRLQVDLFGNITNWPQGFFGDEMGDLVAMAEAQMRREAVARQ